MANGTFQIVPFGNVPFPNVLFECSCLWAMSLKFGNEIVSGFEQGCIHIEFLVLYSMTLPIAEPMHTEIS